MYAPFFKVQRPLEMAVTEMVADLIWAPGNLGPGKFVPREIWSLPENHYIAFSCRNQSLWGPNFLGTKKVRSPNEIRDHFSYSP